MKTMKEVIKKIKIAVESNSRYIRFIQYDENKMIQDIAEISREAHIFRVDGNFTTWMRDLLYEMEIAYLEIECERDNNGPDNKS